MSTPSATVLLPVYNVGDYIGKCLESMLNQSYANYKILVVNDGSTDDTLDIVKKYPVQVISYEKNMGISHALNMGIDHIDTDYTIRMDGDDISHRDRIQIQINFMEKNPEIFMSGCTSTLTSQLDNNWDLKFAEKKMTTAKELRLFYLYHTYLLHPSIIFRTKQWQKKNYRYDSQFNGVEDFELHRRIIMEEEVYQLHLPLISLTSRDGSASSTTTENTLHRLFLANKHYYERFGITGETIKIMAKALFPHVYSTTKIELQEIEQFTYKILEHDYFKEKITKEMVAGLFNHLYAEVKA